MNMPENVTELLQSIKNKPGAVDLKDVQGEISFDRVSFSYVDNTPVLQDVTFTCKPG